MNPKVKLHILNKFSNGISFSFLSYEETKEIYFRIEDGYGPAHACECILHLSRERLPCGLKTFTPNDSLFVSLKTDKNKRLDLLSKEKELIFSRCASTNKVVEQTSAVEAPKENFVSSVVKFFSKFQVSVET